MAGHGVAGNDLQQECFPELRHRETSGTYFRGMKMVQSLPFLAPLMPTK